MNFGFLSHLEIWKTVFPLQKLEYDRIKTEFLFFSSLFSSSPPFSSITDISLSSSERKQQPQQQNKEANKKIHLSITEF